MRWTRLAPPLLFAVAAGWFALGWRFGLEWVDSGMIVYPSWRVANGALPYRDFTQMFGPALFYANAAVLRGFGADLAVLRWAVLGLKAAVAVLVYLCARQLAAAPFALAAFALTVAVWGAPWWLFNTPYANHYAVALQLAGLWCLAAPRRPGIGRGLTAGLCFGVAATFKQTSGLFAAAAVAVALIGAPPRRAGAAGVAPPGARVLALAALVGVLAVVVAYLAPRNTAWNLAVLAPPLLLLIGWAAYRAARGQGAGWSEIAVLVALAAGLAAPPLAWAVYFAAHGALGALVFNVVSGLPQRIDWFQPLPAPPPGALGLLVAGAALLLALHWRRAGRPGPWWGAAAVLAVAASLAVVGRWPGGGDAWVGDLFMLLFLLLPLLAWASVGQLLRAPEPRLALYVASAAAALLFLYPAGDFWHATMIVPLFLPLGAAQAQRCHAALAAARPPRRALGAPLALAGLALALAAPFVGALVQARRSAPAPVALPRAGGLRDASSTLPELAALLAVIAAQPAERALFTTGNESMLYFLAGRESALAADEFVLYLVGFGVIDPADAHALLPEARLRERLDGARPLIIDQPGPAAARLRAAYPAAAAFIDAHYRPVRTIGPYRVLDWTDG